MPGTRPTPLKLPGNALPRGSEAGVVLILTLFVILITYALVTQLTLGSTVAYQTVRNSADRVQMMAACRSAEREILDVLMNDSAGGAGDGPMGAMGGGTLDQGGGEGADGAEGEEEGDDGSNADSFEDPWAKPMRIVMNDVEITTWVQDENSKFNIVTLITEDEEFSEDARRRCVRILERLRDDFEETITTADAEIITAEIVEWLEGRTRTEEFPRPPRHSTPEEAEWVLPNALEELLMLRHVTEEIFYDQLVDEDRIAPGLESVFTVYTTADIAPAEGAQEDPSGERATGGPATGLGGEDLGLGTGTDQEQGQAAGGPAAGDQEDRLIGGSSSGVGLLLNLNTAPRAVLEGWFDPSDVPESVITEILEYRNEIDEDALDKLEEDDPIDREYNEAMYGKNQEPPKLYLKQLGDIPEKIENFNRLMDPEKQEEFMQQVGVQSEIFTIYLYARKKPTGWMPETRYQEPPGTVLRMRAVVKRLSSGGTDGDTTKSFHYLESWHEVPYTRWRIPDFQRDLTPFEPPEF